MLICGCMSQLSFALLIFADHCYSQLSSIGDFSLLSPPEDLLIIILVSIFIDWVLIIEGFLRSRGFFCAIEWKIIMMGTYQGLSPIIW